MAYEGYHGGTLMNPLARVQAHEAYAGNSMLGFEADEPAPTMILECGFCCAEIPFLGDGDETIIEGGFRLPEYYIATCPRCDAIYGEGDMLAVIDERRVSAYSDGLIAAVPPPACPLCDAAHALAHCPEWSAGTPLIAELRAQITDIEAANIALQYQIIAKAETAGYAYELLNSLLRGTIKVSNTAGRAAIKKAMARLLS